MIFDKNFMLRFAAHIKKLAEKKRPKAEYHCSECGASVLVDGEEKKYSCEHTEAAIIGSMSAVAKSVGKLKHNGILQ
jgi:hypothetical protein